MRIFNYNIHKEKQWDLDCSPILCIHKFSKDGNRCERILCIWGNKIEIKNLLIKIYPKIQDFWIGAYWERKNKDFPQTQIQFLWICLIPCFPIELSWKVIGFPAPQRINDNN